MNTVFAEVGDLRINGFPTGVDEFHRLPTLLTGTGDAILVDGPFKLSTGERIAAAIRASGKRLTAILVTCHDPDYYFGLGPVVAAFPDVAVWAPPVIADIIAATVAHKLDVWRPRLGAEIPALLADVVLPRRFEDGALALEGAAIEIVTTRQVGHCHLWLPQQRAILGGVQVCSNIHVWMADTPNAAARAPWIASLDDMLARWPKTVLPGHWPVGAPMGAAAIAFTRRYIVDFEEEFARAGDSASLIAAMRRRYPDAALDFVLELGARVCMGEEKWP